MSETTMHKESNNCFAATKDRVVHGNSPAPWFVVDTTFLLKGKSK